MRPLNRDTLILIGTILFTAATLAGFILMLHEFGLSWRDAIIHAQILAVPFGLLVGTVAGRL